MLQSDLLNTDKKLVTRVESICH